MDLSTKTSSRAEKTTSLNLSCSGPSRADVFAEAVDGNEYAKSTAHKRSRINILTADQKKQLEEFWLRKENKEMGHTLHRKDRTSGEHLV